MKDNASTNGGYSSESDDTHYSSVRKDSNSQEDAIMGSQTVTVNGILVDNYMASTNLNECVDALLRKQKTSVANVKSIIRHNNSSKNKDKKRRLRKNREQHEILLTVFEKDPNWEKDVIQKLSDQLGLKESQIYKWNWDQRKK